MATLLLQVAGAALRTALGGPVGGAIGQALGGLAGASIDQAWLGGSGGNKVVQGPRLKEVNGLAATEGAAIPRVYGRARLGGQLMGDTLRGGGHGLGQPQQERRQGRAREEDLRDDLQLPRQSRDRPLRGPDRLHQADLGRWPRTRREHRHDARASRP